MQCFLTVFMVSLRVFSIFFSVILVSSILLLSIQLIFGITSSWKFISEVDTYFYFVAKHNALYFVRKNDICKKFVFR